METTLQYSKHSMLNSARRFQGKAQRGCSLVHRTAAAAALAIAVQHMLVRGCAAQSLWEHFGSLLTRDSGSDELTHCWSQDIQVVAGTAPCGHHSNITLHEGQSAKVCSVPSTSQVQTTCAKSTIEKRCAATICFPIFVPTEKQLPGRRNLVPDLLHCDWTFHVQRTMCDVTFFETLVAVQPAECIRQR
jgi:hypothetical protein